MLNNPNVPIDIFNGAFDIQIYKEKHHWWIGTFIFHPELSLDRFKQFAEKYGYPELLLTRGDISEEDRKQAFLELEANGTSVPTRFIALLSLSSGHNKRTLLRPLKTNTPTLFSQATLRTRHRSHEWLDRLAVALNPNAEKKWLNFLATDGNRYVRAVAQARLSDLPINL
jgi:hypothetical protein